MQTIGFVGLGHMGGTMAARYLAADYAVFGESRDREDAQWLTDQGLRWADTPRAVAEAADIVMTSLPDEDVVESVAAGRDGIVAGLAEGKLWADLSTVSPAASRALAARVRADGKGAQMLDAPVSGSVPQVKTGRFPRPRQRTRFWPAPPTSTTRIATSRRSTKCSARTRACRRRSRIPQPAIRLDW